MSRRIRLRKAGDREKSARRRGGKGVMAEDDPFFRRATGFFLDEGRGEERAAARSSVRKREREAKRVAAKAVIRLAR